MRARHKKKLAKVAEAAEAAEAREAGGGVSRFPKSFKIIYVCCLFIF
jgi:hypothetical protein